MIEFYVFDEHGECQFVTTDEARAIAWCEAHEGFYCSEESEDPDDYDCYDECGFDPYEGCYTYDC